MVERCAQFLVWVSELNTWDGVQWEEEWVKGGESRVGRSCELRFRDRRVSRVEWMMFWGGESLRRRLALRNKENRGWKEGLYQHNTITIQIHECNKEREKERRMISRWLMVHFFCDAFYAIHPFPCTHFKNFAFGGFFCVAFCVCDEEREMGREVVGVWEFLTMEWPFMTTLGWAWGFLWDMRIQYMEMDWKRF